MRTRHASKQTYPHRGKERICRRVLAADTMGKKEKQNSRRALWEEECVRKAPVPLVQSDMRYRLLRLEAYEYRRRGRVGEKREQERVDAARSVR